MKLAVNDVGMAGYVFGFETSQPVSMIGTSIVKVSGIVLAANVVNDELLRMEVQGSNDLMRWFTLHGQDLPVPPNLPQPFESTPATLAVPFAFARVRWILHSVTVGPLCPPMVDVNSWYRITAFLNTGAAPD